MLYNFYFEVRIHRDLYRDVDVERCRCKLQFRRLIAMYKPLLTLRS